MGFMGGFMQGFTRSVLVPLALFTGCVEYGLSYSKVGGSSDDCGDFSRYKLLEDQDADGWPGSCDGSNGSDGNGECIFVVTDDGEKIELDPYAPRGGLSDEVWESLENPDVTEAELARLGDASAYMHRDSCDDPTSFDDCNDLEAAQNPAAEEACDEIDNDCDGDIDEDVEALYFTDADGDGYGDAGEVEASCDVTGSTVAGDCDDDDASVNPGEVEVCDGSDNDCDGAVDEDDADDAVPWYADGDEDGFGNAAVTVSSCTAPAGFVDNLADCDDANDAVHPDAPEVCDGSDNDCDGDVDFDVGEGLRCTVTADATRRGAYGELVGYSLASGDLNGDGRSELLVGARGVESIDFGSDSGGVFIETGPLGAGERDASDMASRYYAEGTAYEAGSSVCVGDFDGDGVGDFATGAPQDATTGPNAGGVYLVLGAPDPGETGFGDAWATALGETNYSGFGSALACGDFDGDTRTDLLVGAPYVGGDSSGTGAPGAVYLLDDPGSGGSLAATATFDGTAADTLAGFRVAAGDLDCSGLDDAIVAAYGVGVLVLADPDADRSFALADGVLSVSDYSGAALAVGDFDGDGCEDLMVGDHRNDSNGVDAGVVYVVLGGSIADRTLDAASIQLFGPAAGAHAGYSGASGDFDGDGREDLLIGATAANGDDGASYIVFGGGSLSDLDLADADWTFQGVDGEMLGGATVAGDFDGDGVSSAVVSAYGASNEGIVYIFDL